MPRLLRRVFCKAIGLVVHPDFRSGIVRIYRFVTLAFLLYITLSHVVYVAREWPPSLSDALFLVTLLYGFSAVHYCAVYDTLCSIDSATRLAAAGFAGLAAGYANLGYTLLLLAAYALMFRGLYVASEALYARCDSIASKWCREWRRELGC